MAKKKSNLRLGEWWDYTPYKLNQCSACAVGVCRDEKRTARNRSI